MKFWNFPIENFKKLSVVYSKFDLNDHGDEGTKKYKITIKII